MAESKKTESNLLKPSPEVMAGYYQEVRRDKEFGGIIDRALKGQISGVKLLEALPLVNENNSGIAKKFFTILSVRDKKSSITKNFSSNVSVYFRRLSTRDSPPVFLVDLNVILKYTLESRIDDNPIPLKTAVAPDEFVDFLVNEFPSLTKEALLSCKQMMNFHNDSGYKRDSKNSEQDVRRDMNVYVNARHKILINIKAENFSKIFSNPPPSNVPGGPPPPSLQVPEEIRFSISYYLQQIDMAKTKRDLSKLESSIKNADLINKNTSLGGFRLKTARICEENSHLYLSTENLIGKTQSYAKLITAVFTKSCDPALIDDNPLVSSTSSTTSFMPTPTPFMSVLGDHLQQPKKLVAPLPSAPISVSSLPEVKKYKREAAHKYAIVELDLLRNIASAYLRSAEITYLEYCQRLEQLIPYENRWLEENHWRELRGIRESWENPVQLQVGGVTSSSSATSKAMSTPNVGFLAPKTVPKPKENVSETVVGEIDRYDSPEPGERSGATTPEFEG